MTKIEERFTELDLMRFLAALSVMVYHYKTKYIETLPVDSVAGEAIYAITKFGYLGVDLFFIISGFVIYCSAAGRNPGQFAISRITRLFPTMWVCMTFTAALSLLLRGDASNLTLTQWLANSTILSKYLGQEYIDGVYWTLEIEIKFYFMVFVLLAGGAFRHERIWLFIWLAATIAFVIFKQPFFMGWFISPEYSSLFIAGITFFLARHEGLQPFHVTVLLISFVMSGRYAFLTVSDFARNVTTSDRWTAVLIVAGFYILFLLIATRRFSLRPTPLLLALGGMTYPLYLLHNRIGKEVFDAFKGAFAALPLLLVIAALVMAASLFIHLVLERQIANRLKAVLINLKDRMRVRII